VSSRNGIRADVVVVWARDTTDGQVKGFLVEKDAPGYDARVIVGKASVRAVLQADITLTGVRVPAGDVLPGARASTSGSPSYCDGANHALGHWPAAALSRHRLGQE
jgi:alkylation response protein AidB-like acyl-CoA dehydrogenase